MDLTDLVRVMFYAMLYKTAEWTSEEMIGKNMQNVYDALSDGPKKPNFFGMSQSEMRLFMKRTFVASIQ